MKECKYCILIVIILTASISLMSTAVVTTKNKIIERERVYYIDLEHMNITYWNPKYYTFMNYSSRRYSRRDPLHYVNVHFETLVPLGNNFSVDIYFYELLSNEYRRSFVEMHYKMCDLMFKDQIIGPFVNQQPYKSCPFPKAVYHRENMTVPDMPLLSTFPFQKGRIYVNFTLVNPGRPVERMVEGYVDAVIKTRWR